MGAATVFSDDLAFPEELALLDAKSPRAIITKDNVSNVFFILNNFIVQISDMDVKIRLRGCYNPVKKSNRKSI